MDSSERSTHTQRILVVDDTEYNRDLLERRLTRRGFNVDSVADGYAALKALEERDYALVLLDIMMPGIDGYEVLAEIRKSRLQTELPIIMVTAKDDSADIVRALELGASDYVTKPIDFAVALARINTHLLVSRSQAALRAAHERMKNDLDAAAKTQRRLLPTELVDDPRVVFGWEYRPCDELGGDMLNVFRIDDRHIGLYVLDVSGHGVQSALLSFALSQSLSPNAGPGSMVLQSADEDAVEGPAAPEEVARRLNAEHSMAANGGLIATLQYGVIDLTAGTFTFVSAGHPDPVRVSGDASSVIDSVGGPPIGVIEDPAYESSTVDLIPGNRIVMVSDGVYEQFSEAHEAFGWERYEQRLADSHSEPVADAVTHLADAVEVWAGAKGTQDDISVIAFDYRP